MTGFALTDTLGLSGSGNILHERSAAMFIHAGGCQTEQLTNSCVAFLSECLDSLQKEHMKSTVRAACNTESAFDTFLSENLKRKVRSQNRVTGISPYFFAAKLVAYYCCIAVKFGKAFLAPNPDHKVAMFDYLSKSAFYVVFLDQLLEKLFDPFRKALCHGVDLSAGFAATGGAGSLSSLSSLEQA